MAGAGSFRSNPNIVSRFDSTLRLEVLRTDPRGNLTRITRHSSHKANDDFLHSGEALELG
jgi:hypothetical protein